MVVVLFSGRVVLQKSLLQSLCLSRCLCSMAILVIWRRDEYDITGGNFRYFPIICLHSF